MQEKLDSSSNTKMKSRTTIEERKIHVENWKKSGLSMSHYCRQNNLAVSNLFGWKNALLTKRKTPLIKPFQPLSLTNSIKPSNVGIVEILIDERLKVRFQQVTDAAFIISIAKGLLPCN